MVTGRTPALTVIVTGATTLAPDAPVSGVFDLCGSSFYVPGGQGRTLSYVQSYRISDDRLVDAVVPIGGTDGIGACAGQLVYIAGS